MFEKPAECIKAAIEISKRRSLDIEFRFPVSFLPKHLRDLIGQAIGDNRLGQAVKPFYPQGADPSDKIKKIGG